VRSAGSAELGAWQEAARLAPAALSAAWKVGTAALSHRSVARAAMSRARFPACSVLARGQAALVSEGYAAGAPLHHLLTREEMEVNGEEIIN